MTRGARVLLLGPYVLLLMVFFAAPLVLMFAISLSRQSFGQLEWGALTLHHYVRFLTDAYYLGVLTPSERHVPQTIARWRASGFAAHVAPLSPYEENDPAAVRRAADALRAGNAGLVVMDCIGFRRKTRDEIGRASCRERVLCVV